MLTIRLATDEDVDAITELVEEAVVWLGASGSDQWQFPSTPARQRVAQSISAGTTWIVEDGPVAVATVVLNEDADPEFWISDDTPGAALYLHRMVVRRSYSGHHLGSSIIDWAGRQAARAGKPLIRLDAWATNEDLHRYYRDQGFTQIRVLQYAHRGSGALFERDAKFHKGQGPQLHEQ